MFSAGDGLEIGAKGLRAFDALRDGDALDAAPFLLDLYKYLPLTDLKERRPMYSPNGYSSDGHVTLGEFPPAWLTRTIGKAQKVAGKIADVADRVRPYTVAPPPMQGVNVPPPPPAYQIPARPALPGWVIPAVGAVAVFAFLKWRRVI